MSGFAIRKDGRGWRAVNGPDDLFDDEIFSASEPGLVATADRVSEIRAELLNIDADSQRPARVVALAYAKGLDAPAFEVSKLESLEARAVVLRAELKALTGE